MAQRHSTPIRGLMSYQNSRLLQGRFGQVFGSLSPAKFGTTDADNLRNLAALAQKMSASFDPPTEGTDPEESGIPALYTYLAQFIDHDITFDPASSWQMRDDPDALTDFRTPGLNLDSVYGGGPANQPYIYDGANGFLLGKPLSAVDPKATDLPRNSSNPACAVIPEPRNDENVILSQLHGLFHRFHNRLSQENKSLQFEQIQRLVRFNYQYVLLNDFLPRIVNSSVIDELKTDGSYDRKKLKFFHWKSRPFIPVEFSVAAYRFGHSMIRPGYQLNDGSLLPIFTTDEAKAVGFSDDLTGFRAVKSNQAIDWGRFIDIDIRNYEDSGDHRNRRLQFAFRIDTSLVNALSNLPIPKGVAEPPGSLALRNLIRGWRLDLPSGQMVARAMGLVPLDDNKILIGKGVDKQDPGDPVVPTIDTIAPVFRNNCPLWTYILAEAMHHQEMVSIPVLENIKIGTPRLGPVGGRIVAEVFLGLIFGDCQSLLALDPIWQPSKKPYCLKDFVNYALGN